MPAATAACRAGICPAPAVNTWPMITYSTKDAGTLAFSRAPLMAMAPSSLALKSFREPINLPMGVRAPATITDVVMTTSSAHPKADLTDPEKQILSLQVTVV
ncbi:Uncharacterised protein [Mycobacterium tuberculosis]|nr:Uncharacterised protein [Mycobacterium tuberculosis]